MNQIMMNKKISPSEIKAKYNDWNKIALIDEELADNQEELLEKFGVEYKRSNKMLYSSCPVHGGDKFNAFNWYEDGKWKCRTHNCHLEFKTSPIGLLRGLLSHNECDWVEPGNRKYNWDKTVEFALAFLKKDYSKIDVDLVSLEKKQFAHQAYILNKKEEKPRPKITREMVRKSLIIPAQHYIDKKYDAKLLDKYDVGLCTAQGKEMSWRIVVPIYDADDNFVGCTGRSVFDECKKCKLYHSDKYDCPTEQYKNRYTKWKHSMSFDRENYFYNLNFAKRSIEETQTVVLVESPGNVWRLVQSGIFNVLGCFGASLTDGQQSILDSLGVLNIITLGDGDAGGEALERSVKERCSRTYRLYFPNIIKKGEDIGNMCVDEVTSDIKPIIDKIIRSQ